MAGNDVDWSPLSLGSPRIRRHGYNQNQRQERKENVWKMCYCIILILLCLSFGFPILLPITPCQKWNRWWTAWKNWVMLWSCPLDWSFLCLPWNTRPTVPSITRDGLGVNKTALSNWEAGLTIWMKWTSFLASILNMTNLWKWICCIKLM